MKKAKEHASELLAVYAEAIRRDNWELFTEKVTDVFREVAVNEVQEMQKARNISLDTGTAYNMRTILMPIYKSQRVKYSVICKIVNGAHANSLAVEDFDKVVKAVHPKIYDWYASDILELGKPELEKCTWSAQNGVVDSGDEVVWRFLRVPTIEKYPAIVKYSWYAQNGFED